MVDTPNPLPAWSVDQWFNAPNPISLADLRGKVVVIEAFQMLCPGCVVHGLPLAQQVHEHFAREDVAVIGLHTVFEHHAAMTPVSLEAFLHEYRITFPVGVDAPGEAALPVTMEHYGLRGTPSMLLVDRKGTLAAHYYGQISPLRLGAEIAALALGECKSKPKNQLAHSTQCDENGCVAQLPPNSE